MPVGKPQEELALAAAEPWGCCGSWGSAWRGRWGKVYAWALRRGLALFADGVIAFPRQRTDCRAANGA